MTANRTDPVTEAVNVLRSGGVVALPTDTLYALSCNARVSNSVKRVYLIKGREDGKPLPLFVESLAAAEAIAVFTDVARILAGKFWPGQLTIVLRRQPDFVSEALAGGDTVALRVPDNVETLAVLSQLGEPITGTSANRSGGPDPLTAGQVRLSLGYDLDYVLDGGPCPVGVSSTIVDCSSDSPRLLRAGAVSEASLLEALESAEFKPETRSQLQT